MRPRARVPRIPKVRGGAIVVFLLLLAGVFLAPPASGNPAHWRGFYETGQYEFFLGDKAVDGAKIYHSDPAAAYLVVTSKLDYAVLILPRTRCVESVKPDEMSQRDDGGYDISKGTVPCSLGRFRIEGPNILFTVGDQAASLRPKPPLLGGYLRDGVIAHSPQYLRASKAYTPDPKAIEALKKSNKRARIQIFFGSWCSFCQRFIPHALRVEEELADTDFSFEYFGLAPPPAFYVDDIATQMGVKKLPTGIIFIDDHEVGRVIGTEWVNPEQSLLRYLR
jgi:thiol-disulfide isomerase/thioredoxin